MGKYSTPGKSEVAFATTASDYTAITAAEANAGTDLTSSLRNMPSLPRSHNQIDVATLDTKFEKRQVGTRGGDTGTIEILRDDSSETAYDALPEDATGYLIVARKGLATTGTFAISDEVDVFPITIGSVADGEPGRNDPDHAIISFEITDTPARGQTIAS